MVLTVFGGFRSYSLLSTPHHGSSPRPGVHRYRWFDSSHLTIRLMRIARTVPVVCAAGFTPLRAVSRAEVRDAPSIWRCFACQGLWRHDSLGAPQPGPKWWVVRGPWRRASVVEADVTPLGCRLGGTRWIRRGGSGEDHGRGDAHSPREQIFGCFRELRPDPPGWLAFWRRARWARGIVRTRYIRSPIRPQPLYPVGPRTVDQTDKIQTTTPTEASDAGLVRGRTLVWQELLLLRGVRRRHKPAWSWRTRLFRSVSELFALVRPETTDKWKPSPDGTHAFGASLLLHTATCNVRARWTCSCNQ